MKKTPSTKILGVAAMLGLAMLLNSVNVYAQKAPKRNGKSMPEATLSEAKVVAKLSSNAFELQPLKIRLYVLNPSGKRVTVGIRNYENNLVYSDYFFGKEYLRNLNFSTMLSGNYSLRIDSRKEHVSRPFVIQDIVSRNIVTSESQPVMPSNLMANIYKSEESKVKIHLNNPGGKVVELIIRNDADEIVYRSFDHAKQITRVLNMSLLGDGKYTLQLKSQDENSFRNFAIVTSKEKAFAWIDKSGKPIKQDKATAFIK
jgi:hypothetical protein